MPYPDVIDGEGGWSLTQPLSSYIHPWHFSYCVDFKMFLSNLKISGN